MSINMSAEQAIESIAEACHNMNRAYCRSMDDMSQPTWAEAPEWQRASAVMVVKASLLDPTMTPENSHEIWMARKDADGWIYGKTKVPELKMHPCMVPYDQLPEEQRKKDELFIMTVAANRHIFESINRQ